MRNFSPCAFAQARAAFFSVRGNLSNTGFAGRAVTSDSACTFVKLGAADFLPSLSALMGILGSDLAAASFFCLGTGFCFGIGNSRKN